jgi:hypothetical protein
MASYDVDIDNIDLTWNNILKVYHPLEYTLLLQIDYERFQLVAVNDFMAGSV